MMRERSDPAQKKCIITSLCIVAILLGFLYVYYGSLFSSQSHGASALEYGSRSLRKLGSSCLGEDEDNNKKQDESSTKYGQENGEDDVTLKNLLMEHYERHCPTLERRFNCLIPPPPRSQSNGPKAEMKFQKQIYLILTLHMRNPIRTRWLKKVKRYSFLGEAHISTVELIGIFLQLQICSTFPKAI
ncbi:hypothetical protein ACFX2I_012658 [Malus domestica]